MPTYEYQCLKCKKKFEVFQSIKDEPLKKHPRCGGKVKRLISAGAGIIFKGSGFYQTDYKMKSLKPAESRSAEKAKDAAQTKEKKSETNPSPDSKNSK
ncbi:MAG: zinc ribbon domain-containing protein [Candidatus Aureabacteria bacterium]|nr:zinc ribbon domain-containing protein [Candidatus Auribacterota bacterium]